MDLASYLLKPIQRMSKYALLLKDLIGTCGEAQEQELAYLRAAEQMVRFQLRHGNDLLAMDAIRHCDVCIDQAGVCAGLLREAAVARRLPPQEFPSRGQLLAAAVP